MLMSIKTPEIVRFYFETTVISYYHAPLVFARDTSLHAIDGPVRRTIAAVMESRQIKQLRVHARLTEKFHVHSVQRVHSNAWIVTRTTAHASLLRGCFCVTIYIYVLYFTGVPWDISVNIAIQMFPSATTDLLIGPPGSRQQTKPCSCQGILKNENPGNFLRLLIFSPVAEKQ